MAWGRADLEAFMDPSVRACATRDYYAYVPVCVDVHIELEKLIARFLQVTEAILYSDAFACVVSVIPAFAKKGDLIVWYGTVLCLFLHFCAVAMKAAIMPFSKA